MTMNSDRKIWNIFLGLKARIFLDKVAKLSEKIVKKMGIRESMIFPCSVMELENIEIFGASVQTKNANSQVFKFRSCAAKGGIEVELMEELDGPKVGQIERGRLMDGPIDKVFARFLGGFGQIDNEVNVEAMESLIKCDERPRIGDVAAQPFGVEDFHGRGVKVRIDGCQAVIVSDRIRSRRLWNNSFMFGEKGIGIRLGNWFDDGLAQSNKFFFVVLDARNNFGIAHKLVEGWRLVFSEGLLQLFAVSKDSTYS